MTELILRNALHPLSRDPFAPEMIISKDKCHFNITNNVFTHYPYTPFNKTVFKNKKTI
ncbi:hypothetical protein ECDEC9A_1516 [Escherichia coli DEC9A]|nr:hypothetical protein ECDEC9A_1516 [Escherichia coli DEC9A]